MKRYYLVKENFNNGMDKREHFKGEKLNYKDTTVINSDGEIVFHVNSDNYINRGIEVIEKIEMNDCMTKKEFNKKLLYNDLQNSRAMIWNDEQGLYIEVLTEIDEEYITIAYSNNFEDTEENKEFLMKNINKAVAKYKKWFEEFEIEFKVLKEIVG